MTALQRGCFGLHNDHNTLMGAEKVVTMTGNAGISWHMRGQGYLAPIRR